MSNSLVLFSQDLRIHDNPAVLAAAQRGAPLLFVYEYEEMGDASKWWLHHSLKSLAEDLKQKGFSLCLVRNEEDLLAYVKDFSVDKVYCNHRVEPSARKKRTRLKKKLQELGASLEVFNGSYLVSPGSIVTPKGTPYHIFTPYSRVFLKEAIQKSRGFPESLPDPIKVKSSLSLEELDLLPKISWDAEFAQHWIPGERGAHKVLRKFLKQVETYEYDRDFPISPTSLLSPHLHFGEISPNYLWHAIGEKGFPYLRQLIWREFSASTLYFFPEMEEKPLRSEFAKFPWEKHPKLFRLWTKGLTGYPIVDAGMRELWKTGWMHGRVRMIAASFLVKDLGVSWTEGAKWFMDTLVDADVANNAFGWQWVAGCGFDAAPYFRVFNPILQSAKFDPQGEYIRKYIPELARLPNKWIHEPWNAPKEVLEKAGVILGENYPFPLVDHDEARLKALAAYKNRGES